MLPNCYLCGRFVGQDGDPDVAYDHYAGGWEIGYSRCGRCVREHRGSHRITRTCLDVHRDTLSEEQIARCLQS